MKVSKWGNSLAVRLPVKVVDALDLEDGSEVDVNLVGTDKIEITRTLTREEALARVKALQWPLPPDYKFDRLEAHERGERPGDEQN